MQENLFETQQIPNFNKPPLPFMGNKTKMLKPLKACLETLTIPKDTIFLDVFGGSGLVAHNLKMWYPNNRVIWNDFDNYQERLDKIPITQEIIDKFRPFIAGRLRMRTDKESKKAIKEILRVYPEKDLDCISLSSYLLFGGSYALTKKSLLKGTFYNQSAPKIQADGYLQGVERVSMDFKDLLDKYKGDSILPILDPPYLQTQKGNYRMHFMVKDFLHLMDRIKDFKTCLLFSSVKSENQEFLDYFKIPYQVYEKQFSVKTTNKDLLLFIQQKVA